MNAALEQLAAEVGLGRPENEGLRWAFGRACVARVEHLLEAPEVMACLQAFGQFLVGELDQATFSHAQREAESLAHRHQGSKSIDGCGHAAVSASYALAHAMQGKALQAASYAAYAKVYAEGGYGAVAEREAFEPEFAWQVSTLSTLFQQRSPHRLLLPLAESRPG